MTNNGIKLGKIAFIGAGNMAKAIISGLLSSGVPANTIAVSARSEDSLNYAKNTFGVATGPSADIVRDADIIVLAVKPQQIKEVTASLRGKTQPGSLVISIAAGVRIEDIESSMGECAMIRCMPNTPSAVGMGASGLFANTRVSDEQKHSAEAILGAVGTTIFVAEEHLIDAVTAVSGSGPAYFFLFIEAMTDAGIELGLDKETSEQLAKQTALGAATLATKSEIDVQKLRKNVTSPNGTTEQAIKSFESNKLRAIVSQAMHACRDRAIELSKPFSL